MLPTFPSDTQNNHLVCEHAAFLLQNKDLLLHTYYDLSQFAINNNDSMRPQAYLQDLKT